MIFRELPQSAPAEADDGERAVGYVLGTANTPSFVEEYRRSWLPGLLERYPAPTGEPTTPTEVMIDLLPDHQRADHGRALMEALARMGVPAAHLGMPTANTAARAFHDRLGFHTIAHADLIYQGLEVGPNARLGGPAAG